MLRRISILCALLLLSLSAEAVTLKMATLVPDGTSWMREFKAAASEVEKRTEGRVKLKFFPGGVMGSDKSVMRKMRVGQLHGGAISGGALAEHYSGAQIYSLPFLFRNYDEVRHVRELVDPAIKAGLEKKGFVVLGISEGGFAYLMSDKPIQTSDDLTEQKVWIPEGDVISLETFKSAGISPISLPVSDVYTGLQTGLIDTVGINPTGAIALQWHTKVKYLTNEPLLFIMGYMVVDKRAFKKVSSADQVVVKEAVAAAFGRLDALNRKDDEGAFQALQANGVSAVNLSDEDRQKWKKVSDAALDALAQQNVYPVELLQKIQAKLASYRSQSGQ